MKSHSETGELEELRQQLEPGEQVLVSVASMQSPLERCPPTGSRRILLLSGAAPGRIQDRLSDLGIPIENVGLIPLSESEYGYTGSLRHTDPVSPGDLTGISIEYVKALESLETDDWVVFDDLGILPMYVDKQAIVRLLTHLTQRASERDLTGIYGVTRPAVDDETYRVLQRSVDRTIDMGT